MMLTLHDENESSQGPYTPLVILHGGAGSITRAGLPPDLYQQYHNSLKFYLESTQALLEGHASNTANTCTSRPKATNAVDAAVHAVSLLEDDPLFNCGHGAVFNTDGEVQMEASLAVSSIHDPTPNYLPGHVKKSAAVSMVMRTRHPIQLAKLVLEMADAKDTASVRDMHGHLSGQWIENLGFQHGLERKPRRWFWTRKRWDEHRRGLGLSHSDEEWKRKLDEHETDEVEGQSTLLTPLDISQQSRSSTKPDESIEKLLQSISHYHDLPSQGTVGAVCMDSWGNLAVATSTGGLTNKRPGRIGDTPTVGAGFWAESWSANTTSTVTSDISRQPAREGHDRHLIPLDQLNKLSTFLAKNSISWLQDCFLPSIPEPSTQSTAYQLIRSRNDVCDQKHDHHDMGSSPPSYTSPSHLKYTPHSRNTPSSGKSRTRTRAIALSGTGNGDSFLRTCLARTTSSLLHYNTATSTLQDAVTLAAGPNGILQQSAESRWNTPGGAGEGEGGMIGIEAIHTPSRAEGQDREGEVQANVVFDFNCGGMWRAYFVDEEDGENGEQRKKRVPKVMVFREEY